MVQRTHERKIYRDDNKKKTLVQPQPEDIKNVFVLRPRGPSRVVTVSVTESYFLTAFFFLALNSREWDKRYTSMGAW